MSRLFISHSSANNAEAVAIRDWLAREGWDEVFLDLDPARGIVAGERWERALNEAASRCEAVVFLISRAWLDSRWCMKEFNLARRLNKRLFGVLIEAIPLADLPEDLSGTWQVVDLAAGQDHEMFRVALPRTQEEAHVTFSREGLARLRGGLARAGLEPRFFDWPPKDDPERPPYRGLKPLEAEDAGIFFGRDAPIVEALDRLRGLREAAAPRLLVILGASGSGKSSFLRAGLLPRLARDDRNFLPLPAIRPEHAALTGDAGLVPALEAALAARGLAHRRADIRKAVAGGAEPVRELLQQIADKAFTRTLTEAGAAPHPTIVIAIDQAEELFTADGLNEGEALLALLRDLAGEDRPGIIVLFTIRSDSYDRLETARPLEGLRQQTLPLLPMPRGAYQTVIEGPSARLAGTERRLRIEPRLTQRLLEDIEKGGGSDALPLLAFTLEQLYRDYGGDGALAAADYEAFGGIGGAIEAAVERALKAADADPRIPREREARLTLLRRGLIPWLAGIDAETGSPRRRIARLADVPAEAAPLIGLLVEQRLLSTDAVTTPDGGRETTIEPAHEALLRQWGLLRGWLEEDLGALTTLEAVKRGARDWEANARAPDWLNHAGGRLEDAEQVAARPDFAADLSEGARDYLRRCREAETARRREREAAQERARKLQRSVLSAVTIGLVAALVLAGLAGWQWRAAQTQQTLAEAQTKEAERALALLQKGDNEILLNVVLGSLNQPENFNTANAIPSLLNPVTGQEYRFFLDEGFTPSVLFYLFVDTIELTVIGSRPPARTFDFQSFVLDDFYNNRYETVADYLLAMGLNIEVLHTNNQTVYRPCFNPPAPTAATIDQPLLCGSNDSAGSSASGNRARTSGFIAPDLQGRLDAIKAQYLAVNPRADPTTVTALPSLPADAKLQLRLILRSPGTILRYLGNVVARELYQGDAPLRVIQVKIGAPDVPYPALPCNPVSNPAEPDQNIAGYSCDNLFVLDLDKPSAANQLAITYQGHKYAVPADAHIAGRTLRVIDLLKQFISARTGAAEPGK